MKHLTLGAVCGLLAILAGLPARADFTTEPVAKFGDSAAAADQPANTAVANFPEAEAEAPQLLIDGQNFNSPFMRVYSVSLPPIGYVRFCERQPEECSEVTTSNDRVELTQERWQELEAVNRFVNQEIYPVTDQELYGRVEFWTYPNNKGDCEDYVLMKRRLLMERGWPASALLITVVLDEEGAGHAILTARTASGDFLLDNKQQDVLAWHDAPYRFLKRQSYRDPQVWMALYPTEENGAVAAFSSESTENK